MSVTIAPPTGVPSESTVPPALPQVSLPESKKNAVYFFGTEGPFGGLSNFYPAPFRINAVQWPTVEHYYQAQKFIGSEIETQIREAADPADAKKLAKTHEKEVREDWEQIKENVMLAGLLAKFSQNAHMATVLLDTKTAFLVEHSKKDAYWGDGHANGLNRLGVLLMEVRGLVRKELGLPEEVEEYVAEKDLPNEAALKKMLAQLMARSDAIDEGIIESSAPLTKRKLRRRPGNASRPYRTADGTPMFEKEAGTGQITLIDAPEIVMSPKSLTPAARTVTFLYQFEKRDRREANMLEPEDLEELEEDEDIDFELEAAYAPPPVRPSLDDIVASRALDQLLDETELALVMATSLEDHTSDDFVALTVQLKSLNHELQKHVHKPQEETTLDRILTTLSAIDTLITAS